MKEETKDTCIKAGKGGQELDGGWDRRGGEKLRVIPTWRVKEGEKKWRKEKHTIE